MIPAIHIGRRQTRVAVAGAGLLVATLIAPGQAIAQFGQASPHTLELNEVFSFNGDKDFFAKPPDCKGWSEAAQAFDALRSAGKAVTVVKGKSKVDSFIEHAYAERLSGIAPFLWTVRGLG